jgi:hypothetical protein
MAAERRFAALAQIRRQPVGGESRPDTTAPIAITPSALTARPQGRPPGKRSDPNWKPRTILMRTRTHRRVASILLERDDAPDLSELVDELLTEWLAKQ